MQNIRRQFCAHFMIRGFNDDCTSAVSSDLEDTTLNEQGLEQDERQPLYLSSCVRILD